MEKPVQGEATQRQDFGTTWPIEDQLETLARLASVLGDFDPLTIIGPVSALRWRP